MPQGTTDLTLTGEWWDPTMFGVDVLAPSHRLTLLFYFPIPLAVWSGVAESVYFVSGDRRKLGFSPLKFFRGTYEEPYDIGHKIFQNIRLRAVKSRENRPRNVENMWWGKNK